MDFKTHLNKYLNDLEIDQLLNSLNKERTSSLVLNLNKLNKEFFLKEHLSLKELKDLNNAYSFNKNEFEAGKSYLFDNGAYYIMDSASMMVGELLAPKENDLILDMCAAPGGKTIYTNLNNKNLRIVANDVSHSRCLTMSSNIEKLGFNNVIIINFDFLKDKNILNNTFDKIILDAPCSGSAMFRKNEEIEKDWSYEKVLYNSKVQKELLDRAFDLLKDGGELIYSTCSFSYEEDEENIFYILNKRNDIELINLPHIEGEYRNKQLKEAIHLFPHLFNGEGQFIAKFKKIGINKQTINQIYKNNLEKIDKEIINDFSLNFNSYKKINDKLYGCSFHFDNKKIPLIRYGVEIAEIKKNYYLPSFNLAHYLTSSTISLNEEEMKKYIKGETILKKINIKNGYYAVSYNSINLGFIKYVDGVLKNLYPKGLRH